MKTITSVLALGIALFASAPAFADHTTLVQITTIRSAEIAPAHTPSFATSRAGVVVDLWPTRTNFSTTLGAELQIRVSDKLFLDLSYAGAFAHIGDVADEGDYVSFGNPTIGLHVADSPTRNFSYFIGGSITAPLLHDPSDAASNAAFYGSRVRGFYDADRFVRGHMAARASAGIQLQGMGPLLLRGEVRPVLYIPTSEKHAAFPKTRTSLAGSATEMTIESAVEIEARSDMGIGGGARLQAVVMPTHDDKIQILAEPFIQMVPKREGVYARIGFPLALDETLGFGVIEDKLAGIKLSLGGQW